MTSIQLKDQAIQTALTGDWKTAVAINKELLQENPQDIDALNRLALAFMVTGKVKSAKTTYQKVLAIDPLNPIAIRNLKYFKGTTNKQKSDVFGDFQINNKFLEETGKTKVVELVNIAQPTVIQALRTGQTVNLSIKRLKLFVLKGEKQYLGVLPDDIGRRLIKFIKAGNKYEAYIKSVNPHKVIVFIKEIKRSARFKNQPSFLAASDNSLFDKNEKKNMKKYKDDMEEEENYLPEEEAETPL